MGENSSDWNIVHLILIAHLENLEKSILNKFFRQSYVACICVLLIGTTRYHVYNFINFNRWRKRSCNKNHFDPPKSNETKAEMYVVLITQ